MPNFDQSMPDVSQPDESGGASFAGVGDQGNSPWSWAMRYMADTVGKSGKGTPGGQGGGPGSNAQNVGSYGTGPTMGGNTYNFYGGGPSSNGASPIAGGVGAVAKYLVKGFTGGGWYPGATPKPKTPVPPQQQTPNMTPSSQLGGDVGGDPDSIMPSMVDDMGGGDMPAMLG